MPMLLRDDGDSACYAAILKRAPPARTRERGRQKGARTRSRYRRQRGSSRRGRACRPRCIARGRRSPPHSSKAGEWKGSGGGILDKFVATTFGQEIAGSCSTKFLGRLPPATKLVLMFGLGTKGNYVREARK